MVCLTQLRSLYSHLPRGRRTKPTKPIELKTHHLNTIGGNRREQTQQIYLLYYQPITATLPPIFEPRVPNAACRSPFAASHCCRLEPGGAHESAEATGGSSTDKAGILFGFNRIRKCHPCLDQIGPLEAKPTEANRPKVNNMNTLQENQARRSQLSYNPYYQSLTAIFGLISRKLVPSLVAHPRLQALRDPTTAITKEGATGTPVDRSCEG